MSQGNTQLSAAQRRQGQMKRSLRTVLEQGKERFRSVLPKHVTPDRMINIALTAATLQPKLLDCTPESVGLALLTASQTGLEPDGYHGHLVPYKRHCQFIPDYKGLIQLALNNGVVIDAYAVYENDEFDYQLGSEPRVIHKPVIDDDRGSLRCAYAVAHFKNGTKKFVVATRKEVEKRKKASASSDKSDSPWNQWEDEMWIKGLDIGTPIPTPSGWTRMGDIEVGDVVFDCEGRQVSVTHTSEVKNLPCYRITFTNGEQIVCDDEHRWIAKIGRGRNAYRQPFEVLPIDELYEAKTDGLSVTVPVHEPLECQDGHLVVPPYLLGYWLGNGTSTKASITCNSQDVEFLSDVIGESKYELGSVRHCERSNAATIGIREGFLDGLRMLGVIGNKHVPTEYLRGSIPQRRQLLQGLMDSDGHIDKERGKARFSSVRPELANAVAELASSLGEVPRQGSYRREGFGVQCVSHEVAWQPRTCCVQVSRKRANYSPRKIVPYRAIKSIERIRSTPTRCISVDSESKTYLAGRTMVPTHNTAVKMLMKYVPRSPELTYATSADDMAEMGLQQQPMTAPGQIPREPSAPRQSRSEEALGILGEQEQGQDEPESGEAISNPENAVQVFSEALEPLESEEEVNRLWESMIEANRNELTPQSLADAKEARDVKVAVINGEIQEQ